MAEGEERGELKINLSIPNPNHQCTSCALFCLIAVRRGVWLRSCFAKGTHLGDIIKTYVCVQCFTTPPDPSMLR